MKVMLLFTRTNVSILNITTNSFTEHMLTAVKIFTTCSQNFTDLNRNLLPLFPNKDFSHFQVIKILMT